MTSPSRIALYPGCSLEGSATSFATSLDAVFEALGIERNTLKDWSCCGATSAHAIDRKLYLSLNLRNLALAEQQGYDELLAPCAACYNRLAGANHALLEDRELLNALNSETDLEYGGGVRVRNVLDYLVNVVGVERIAARVTKQLRNVKAACYYGCLNTRVPRMKPFDTVEYPMSMDHIMRGLGAKTIDWSYKTECCGASLFLTAETASAKLVAKILKDAIVRGANCIVVGCPMCQNNLDTKQDEIRAQFDIPRAIPIVFVTQLIGLAFGIDANRLKMSHNFVPFDAGNSV